MMRGALARIITLFCILFLLTPANVSARPMPVVEGNVFHFEWIREKSCVEIYPYLAFDIEVGEKDVKEIELIITEINYDDETIDFDFIMEDGNGSISSRLSSYVWESLIHPRYEMSIFGRDSDQP